VKRCKGVWWPAPFMAALTLTLTAMAVSASTTAPDAYEYRWTQLSTSGAFAAYPDIATGSGGLVAVVWSEGTDLNTKHNGPLRLAWVNQASSGWKAQEVDGSTVYDAAVAVSDSTLHVVWTRPRDTLRYTECTPDPASSTYACGPSQPISSTPLEGGQALQADIVVDDSGTPHVVWAETAMSGDTKVHKVYYSRKEGTGWRPKDRPVPGSKDSEAPALAYANGYLHVVWTEWPDPTHVDSEINYCRRSTNGEDWAPCLAPLFPSPDERIPIEGYLARNPSIAADNAGNVYTVWDIISDDDGGSRRQYAIGYKHATGELGDLWVEYVHFLRPHVSLAVSGTTTVPVLTWHAQTNSTGGEEGMAQTLNRDPHKVYWTHATRPGSYKNALQVEGYMYWASEYDAISWDLCGDLNTHLDSATSRIALVGDLNGILSGTSPDDYLHAVYHEEAGDSFWSAIYNNSRHGSCLGVHMPLLLRNWMGTGDE
jgi:hypothetical protein